jgi:hypothetical protein
VAETAIVRALLTALAFLEDIADLDPDSSMLSNAIEGIAYDLGPACGLLARTGRATAGPRTTRGALVAATRPTGRRAGGPCCNG